MALEDLGSGLATKMKEDLESWLLDTADAVKWNLEEPTPKAAEAAGQWLDRALRMNPRMDRAYVFRGRIHRVLGRAREAESEFEKALTCNPACAEALAELRLVRG